VGYLSFRYQRRLNAAAIVHLCVQKEKRGEGVSDALFAWLRDHGTNLLLSSIRLKCRRDYKAERLWERLGMVPRGDVPGRGRDGAFLTVWVHSLGKGDDLFAFASSQADDDRLTAVMDANVFFDLHGDPDSEKESRVLLEPWFDDAVKLCVVDELRAEINRQLLTERRDSCHRAAEHYDELQYQATLAESHEEILNEVLGGPPESPSEISDRKQLARSAAAGAQVFLTRDEELLDATAEIYARLGIEVMRPTELSGRLDEVERATRYQPVRLNATALTSCAVRSVDVEEIASRLQLSQMGEKASSMEASVRCLLAQVRSAESTVLQLVRDASGVICAFVSSQPVGKELRVLYLRLARGALADTLARHLLLDLIRSSALLGSMRLRFQDTFVSPIVADALMELGFSRSEGIWLRETPVFIGTREGLNGFLIQSGAKTDNFEHLSAFEMERRLWPAKVTGAGIGCSVVPIRPTWAAQLFDSKLAAGELFGAATQLALNRENVYYRRPKNGNFTLPSRLLWYVSQDSDVPDTMCIRACSRLVSVDVGPAKALFGKNRRLGIYQWREIRETAEPETNEIMVLRFADTEEFRSPVPLAFTQSIGIKSNFPSPMIITEEQFLRIYQKGMAPS